MIEGDNFGDYYLLEVNVIIGEMNVCIVVNKIFIWLLCYYFCLFIIIFRVFWDLKKEEIIEWLLSSLENYDFYSIFIYRIYVSNILRKLL